MATWWRAVRLPALLAAVNWVAMHALFILGPHNVVPTLAFATRAALCVWVGWRVRAQVTSRLFLAALSGVVIMLVDHAIIRSIVMVILHFISPPTPPPEFSLGFNVLALWFTLVMFAPIPMTLAFIGAVAQGWRRRPGAPVVQRCPGTAPARPPLHD